MELWMAIAVPSCTSDAPLTTELLLCRDFSKKQWNSGDYLPVCDRIMGGRMLMWQHTCWSTRCGDQAEGPLSLGGASIIPGLSGYGGTSTLMWLVGLLTYSETLNAKELSMLTMNYIFIVSMLPSYPGSTTASSVSLKCGTTTRCEQPVTWPHCNRWSWGSTWTGEVWSATSILVTSVRYVHTLLWFLCLRQQSGRRHYVFGSSVPTYFRLNPN